MVRIEQAVFTSAVTDRRSGYHLVATSPGIVEADAKELSSWGPSHDSLVDSCADRASVNFHPLPSGAYCVSRTVAQGHEPSSRGVRVYTQCLVADEAALARFSNNPFLLLEAAQATGGLTVYDRVPDALPALDLPGRAATVEQPLLERLAAAPGPQWMGTLTQAALESACLAIAGADVEPLLAGLMSLLPTECRCEFSFSTGLKFSIQRPFRIVTLPCTAADLPIWQRRYNLTVLDFSAQPPSEYAPLDGWPRLVERSLATGRVSTLAMQLSRHRPGLTTEDLPALGLQLLEELDASALRRMPERRVAAAACEDGVAIRQAHAGHPELFPSATTPERPGPVHPSHQLHPDSPAVLEKLEHLDDAVFDAMAGKPGALDTLRRLWPRIRQELGPELLTESSEQYLRYALSIWEQYSASREERDPTRALQALDVLCILFDRI
jgi:hypothetical protein